MSVYPPNFGNEALCTQVDAELWFPVLGNDTTRAAKRICNGDDKRPPCPVREACLAWALAVDERFGVYGGMSPGERKKLRAATRARAARDRKPITHGTEAGAKAHYRRGEKPCGPCADAQYRAHFRRSGAA